VTNHLNLDHGAHEPHGKDVAVFAHFALESASTIA
jgi:hypothetical protein